MVKFNVVGKKDGERPWVTFAKNRVRDNQNFIAMFTGPTGSGKTYNAISYACMIDPEFNVDKQLVFYWKDFITLVNNEEFQQRKIKVIVWDEPQKEMSNRKWQSERNQDVLTLFSTFRAQNIIVLMCAPYIDFLDSSVMKLVHAEIRCKGWNKDTKIGSTMPILRQYNSDRHKFYPHKLIVKENGIGFMQIAKWMIPKAPENVLEAYEKVKHEFNLKTNKALEEKLNTQKKTETPVDWVKELQEANENQEVVYQKYKNSYSMNTIYGNLSRARSILSSGQPPAI